MAWLTIDDARSIQLIEVREVSDSSQVNQIMYPPSEQDSLFLVLLLSSQLNLSRLRESQIKRDSRMSTDSKSNGGVSELLPISSSSYHHLYLHYDYLLSYLGNKDKQQSTIALKRLIAYLYYIFILYLNFI